MITEIGPGSETASSARALSSADLFYRIPVGALGMSLGLFFAITFVLCVGFDLIFPDWAMHPVWLKLLPGFTWLSWYSFLLGLVEAFAYGWYVALIFAPLFNYFASRRVR